MPFIGSHDYNIVTLGQVNYEAGVSHLHSQPLVSGSHSSEHYEAIFYRCATPVFA
tara:strand:- start:354 stop:518 length:165 start_codon:yes stop_codon:yes gene_type:complete